MPLRWHVCLWPSSLPRGCGEHLAGARPNRRPPAPNSTRRSPHLRPWPALPPRPCQPPHASRAASARGSLVGVASAPTTAAARQLCHLRRTTDLFSGRRSSARPSLSCSHHSDASRAPPTARSASTRSRVFPVPPAVRLASARSRASPAQPAACQRRPQPRMLACWYSVVDELCQGPAPATCFSLTLLVLAAAAHSTHLPAWWAPHGVDLCASKCRWLCRHFSLSVLYSLLHGATIVRHYRPVSHALSPQCITGWICMFQGADI